MPHRQVILPHKTISFADSPKDEERGVPMMATTSFPSRTEHCIMWARDEFVRTFSKPFAETLNIVKDPVQFVDGVRAGLSTMVKQGERVWSGA